ncbi:MAG: 4-hydroxy-tetrahydrodipicolinate reductase [Peptococcaceae bacterium]|jgi:4-hydroxy-tetrahydrodipicolinate reductase|nr:4-hydroxy-tetrahydrodipicolinate reductase [Peptococcaceae bacterium]
MKKIRVFVAGAGGKMGSEVVKTILRQEDMQLAGCSDVKNLGVDIGVALGLAPVHVEIGGPIAPETLIACQSDVLIDFTNPQSVLTNAKTAIQAGVVAVVGTTGLDASEIGELQELSNKKGVGLLIVPNFALGAILLMRFAREAAKYFPQVEIIEMHHDQKLDAPSGTALKTAEWIAEVRQPMRQGHPNEYEKIEGARGANVDGIHIHAVRLPGLIAHQEVLFGGNGQVMTLRHDTYNRETYMPGVLLGIRKSAGLTEMVVGLESFLD